MAYGSGLVPARGERRKDHGQGREGECSFFLGAAAVFLSLVPGLASALLPQTQHLGMLTLDRTTAPLTRRGLGVSFV